MSTQPERPAAFPPPPGTAAGGVKPLTQALDLVAPIPERLAQAPLQMDRKTHARLKRGKLAPQSRIDLHGMTLDQAQPRLTAFVLNARAQGHRLVLVITGKGRARDDGLPVPARHGVLRHALMHWLSTPPLADAVLQVAQAHRSHGGGGAFYLYLRRLR